MQTIHTSTIIQQNSPDAGSDDIPKGTKSKAPRAAKRSAATSKPAEEEPQLPSRSKAKAPAAPEKVSAPAVDAAEAEKSPEKAVDATEEDASAKISRAQKRKQKLLKKKKRDLERLSTTLKAKAEITAQDYANLTEKIAAVLNRMTVKGKDNASKITLEKFPWLLDEKIRKILVLSSHRYLTAAPRPLVPIKSPVVGESTTPSGSNPRPLLSEDSAPQFNSASAWRDSAGILIRGIAEDVTGIYLRDVARGIAGQYKADFLELDVTRVHREQNSLLQLSAQERGLAIYKYSRKRHESRVAAQAESQSSSSSGGGFKPPSFSGGGGPAPNVSNKASRITHATSDSQSSNQSGSSNVSGPSASPSSPHQSNPTDGSSGAATMMKTGVSAQWSHIQAQGVINSVDQDTSDTVTFDSLAASSSSSGGTTSQERFAIKMGNFLKSPRGGGGGGSSPGSPGKSPSGSPGQPISQHRNNLSKLGKQVGDLSRGALWHLIMDSLFEMAARDPSQTPRVIYLRRAHLIPPPMLEYLRKKRHQYISNGIPIMFIGSSLDPPVVREDDSMETVLRDIRSSVRPGKGKGMYTSFDLETEDGEDGETLRRDEDEDEDDIDEDDEDAFLSDPDAFDAKVKRRMSGLIVIPPRARMRYKAEARKKAITATFSPQFLIASPPHQEPNLKDTWTVQLQEQLKATTAQANLVSILDAFRFAGLKLQVAPSAHASQPAVEASAVAAAASGTVPAPAEPEAPAEAKAGIVPYARKLSKLLLGDLTPSTGGQAAPTPICSAEAAVFLTGRRLTPLATRNIMEIAVGCARQVGASAVSLQHLSEALELVRLIGVDQSAPQEKATHEKLEAIAHELNDAEKELKNSVVHPNSIATTFDDIGALDSAKRELESLFTPFKLARIFSGVNPLVKVPSGVLLYGPPGTGKTMLARAIAKQAGATFIHISPSNINSKWFGAAERNVAAVFSLAQKLSPAIVFIDEIDSFLSSRSAGDHEATARVKTEFMSNWDGIKNNNEMSRSVIVMGATNRPFDLDLAVLRRLPHRILIDLPDAEARKAILLKVLRQVSLDASTLPANVVVDPLPADADGQREAFIKYLAKATEGYSGSDVHNLCTTAANMLVRDILADKDYKANASVEVIEEIARRHIHRPLGFADFQEAFNQVKPSVDDQDRSISMLRTWQKSFGMGKKTTIGFQ
jgi:SpoVK/Ycf46/Vps4 family AAA+-type ATPase/ribosomal protein S15P/S13E